jgi:hypothetical protein
VTDEVTPSQMAQGLPRIKTNHVYTKTQGKFQKEISPFLIGY